MKNLVLLEERIVQLLNKLKENHLLISQLSEENQGLEKQNLDFKEKVSHLKSENESLKVANSLLGSEESKAVTKRKINSLIKEVDFCIHQLTEINLSLIKISEPTRQEETSKAGFCWKKKKKETQTEM